MTQQAPTPSEAVLIRDEDSYGVYKFPFPTVVVDAAPDDPETLHPCWGHFATLDGDQCTVQTPWPGQERTADVRPAANATGPVSSWLKGSRHAAMMYLVRAMPNFWLNRY